MGEYVFSIHVDAPPELAFQLWTDIGRMREWIEGIARVTDIDGPPGRAGTSYTVWFGRMRSRTRILGAEPPRWIRTRIASRLLRGETEARFEPEDGGTLLTLRFWTEGLVTAIMARVFASGDYRGSFRGELASFARVAAEEARATPAGA